MLHLQLGETRNSTSKQLYEQRTSDHTPVCTKKLPMERMIKKRRVSVQVCSFGPDGSCFEMLIGEHLSILTILTLLLVKILLFERRDQV